jgi:hypothetical protein
VIDTPEFAEEIERARQFAALSGPFDPQDALKASVPESQRAAAATTVASQLATACDIQPAADGAKWLLRATERRWEIASLGEKGRLDEAIAWRRQQGAFDAAAEDVVAALSGAGEFAGGAIEQRLAAAAGMQPEERRAYLQRLASALEWAGPQAPGYAQIERIHGALNRLHDEERANKMLAHGLHGRDEARADLARWIARPASAPPVRALLVSGAAGTGKSSLLEMAVHDALEAGRPLLTVRLDFDRPVLDIADPVGLTLEFARQIASQVPDQAAALREMRLKATAARRDDLTGEARKDLPDDLVATLGRAVTSSGCSVLVVVDTGEVLCRRGQDHVQGLFAWLDRLLARGVGPMSVIAAGPEETAQMAPDHVAHHVELTGLSSDDAEQILDQIGAPTRIRDTIHAIAKGNPLVLRMAGLAARALAPSTRAAGRAKGAAATVDTARLYRTMLAQIADPDLRKLIDPGLLVRRFNHEAIRDVLAPGTGLGRIDETRARRLMDQLAACAWLVESDPVATGWLRQRPDMRSALLPLSYRTKPARCAELDRAAADWFARRAEPWSKVDAAYHRLQLMRRGEAAPSLDRDTALQFDDAMMGELPPRARRVVRGAAGSPPDPRGPGKTTGNKKTGNKKKRAASRSRTPGSRPRNRRR